MKQYQDVFKRYEKKYLLDEIQYRALREWLEPHMSVDQYGLHTICNIYYDTESFELIRASIEKPAYKEKLRLRSYGVPGLQSTVFLELKKKVAGIVYKRRIPLQLDQARAYLERGEHPDSNGQILSEIDYFMQMYQPKSQVMIAYDRIALTGREDLNLRVTFDDNIRWRQSMLDLSRGDWGNPILEPGQILMELKIADAMPVWLSHVLSGLEVFPISFSKYGECYKQNLLHQIYYTGGIHCA